ncbi:MAG: hypothetical protein WD800_01510, partial [Dehalococcoidia bacterium]
SYRALKDEAHRRGASVSAVLRLLVQEHLVEERPRRRLSIEDFTFIGSGSSDQHPGDPLYPVSEHHDEALADDLWAEMSENAAR